jgi:hypothetical protein
LDPIENRKEHTSYWFETGGASDREAGPGDCADQCQPVTPVCFQSVYS